MMMNKNELNCKLSNDNEKIMKCMKELKDLESRKKKLLEDKKINEQKLGEMKKNNENNKNNNLKNTTMIAVTTNNSFDEDCRLKLYYCKTEKNKRQCEYIGLYRDKSIRAIGKIKKVIEVDTINGKLNANLVYGEPIEDTDLAKIEESISKSITLFNYDIGQRKHKYFIVEEFIKTNFVKVSNGGLMGNKYFDLYDILKVKVLPSTKEIAIKLEDKVWQ